MEWGTVSQWMVFGFGVVVLLVGQIVQGKISRVAIKGELSNLKNEFERIKKDVEKNTHCIASIKKRSTDFLPVTTFRQHTADCLSGRNAEARRRDTELEKLGSKVARTHESVEQVANKVDQLLALQTGKVQ